MAGLLSVSPTTMAEDEHAIAAGYKKQVGVTVFIVIAACLSAYLDLKYVVAFGFVLTFGALTFCEARLYDLCIRLKRSNHLAHENREKLEQLHSAIKQLDTRVFHIVNAFDLEEKSTGRLNAQHEALMEQIEQLKQLAETRSTGDRSCAD
jgi:hypothetical protein